MVLVGAAATLASAAIRSGVVCDHAYKYCDPGHLHAGVYTTRYFLPSGCGSLCRAGDGLVTKTRRPNSGSPHPVTRTPTPFPSFGSGSTPASARPAPTRSFRSRLGPARVAHWFMAKKNFIVSDTRRQRSPATTQLSALITTLARPRRSATPIVPLPPASTTSCSWEGPNPMSRISPPLIPQGSRTSSERARMTPSASISHTSDHPHTPTSSWSESRDAVWARFGRAAS